MTPPSQPSRPTVRRRAGPWVAALALLGLAGLTLVGPAGAGEGPSSSACRATEGPNTLVLTARADVCNGLGGGDEIRGLGGNDLLIGGADGDRLFGGTGNDRLLGGVGGDRLFGGMGRDRAEGGPGNDTIDMRDGINGNDLAIGGPGIDICLVDLRDDVRECERPGGPPPPPPPTPNPPPGPPPPPGGRPKIVFGALTQSANPVRFGDRLTYTVPVRNLGSGLAMNVRVVAGRQTAFLRTYVVFDSPDTCVFARDTSNGPTASCGLGNIAPNQMKVLTLVGVVDAQFRDEVIQESFFTQFIASAANAAAGDMPAIGALQNLVVNR